MPGSEVRSPAIVANPPRARDCNSLPRGGNVGRRRCRRPGQFAEAAAGTSLRCCQRCFIASSNGASTERRTEEHTSELESLMRISYAVFCLKKKTKRKK